MNAPTHPGQIVRFREALEAGDETRRFTVLEMREDRVLVQVVGWHNPKLVPTFVYRVAELCVAENPHAGTPAE